MPPGGLAKDRGPNPQYGSDPPNHSSASGVRPRSRLYGTFKSVWEHDPTGREPPKPAATGFKLQPNLDVERVRKLPAAAASQIPVSWLFPNELLPTTPSPTPDCHRIGRRAHSAGARRLHLHAFEGGPKGTPVQGCPEAPQPAQYGYNRSRDPDYGMGKMYRAPRPGEPRASGIFDRYAFPDSRLCPPTSGQ